VAVKIRLKRMGKVRAPHYRIVVADSRTHRDGRVIEEIGRYVPTTDPSIIEVKSDRAQYWLGVGAQPTEQVMALLKLTGDYQASKGEKAVNNVLPQKVKPVFAADSKKAPVLMPKSEPKVETKVEAKAEPKAEAAEAPVEAPEEAIAAVEAEAVAAVEAEASAEAVAEAVAEAPAADVAEAPAEAEAVEADAPAAPEAAKAE